jgi:hypothetical protein
MASQVKGLSMKRIVLFTVLLASGAVAAEAQIAAGASSPLAQSGSVRLIDDEGLRALLGLLQDHRVIPADGSFRRIASGDAVLIALNDGNAPDDTLYLFYWIRNAEAVFLRIENAGTTRAEMHLWNETTEIVIDPTSARLAVTPSSHAFRLRDGNIAKQISSPGDALSCIARSAGVSLDAVNLTNVVSVLSGGACVSANTIALALTATACITGSLPPCLAGVAQLIACGIANCNAPTQPSFAGTWSGPFSSTDGPGTMTMVLNVSGASVTGSINAVQFSQWSGTLNGTVSQTSSTHVAMTFTVQYFVAVSVKWWKSSVASASGVMM